MDSLERFTNLLETFLWRGHSEVMEDGDMNNIKLDLQEREVGNADRQSYLNMESSCGILFFWCSELKCDFKE
jgi:hypothetical protein